MWTTRPIYEQQWKVTRMVLKDNWQPGESGVSGAVNAGAAKVIEHRRRVHRVLRPALLHP